MRGGGDLGYNQSMRIVVIACLLVLSLAGTGQASGDCGESSPCAAIEACAADCAKVFELACIRVKYTPRCDWPAHRCAVPFFPCDRRVCIDAPCHMPVTPCEPCGGWCIPPACHKPVVGADPCDPCPAVIELTGDKSLVAELCPPDCSCETECTCGDG